tara:strand:- start:11306 stop:13123 length:1818 start_codon:yes stop_codon:yes gene_type:complete
MFISAVRTLYIQTIREVDNNIVSKFPIKGKRGTIFDRNGKKMAYDAKVSDIILKKSNTHNSLEIAKFISNNFDLNVDTILSRINNARTGSLKLVSNVNQNLISQLDEDLEQFIEIEVVNSRTGRYYPQKQLASPILGKFSGDMGGWGIEKDLNELLMGRIDSLSHFILNSGKKIPAFGIDDYSNLSGKDVYLTIDIDYQRILSEELSKKLEETNSEYANGIIVDPFSGEILAMVTLPSLDLNKSLKDIESTRNRTVNHSQEPGSTIKTFSILAGLDNDIIDLTDKVFCEASEDEIGEKVVYKFPELNRRPIEDHEGRATISVEEVLAYSSNIGTVKLALKIGKEPIYNTLRRFGFGEPFDFDYRVKDQNEGVLKTPPLWDKYSWSSIPIGQEMQSNNLNLAMAYSAIANGGYLLKPRLVKSVTNNTIDSNPDIIRKVAKKETIVDIVKALKLVVEKGTASKTQTDFCYYGKTGTAQVSFPTEEFTDEVNGRWDEGERFTDRNKNGKWDPAEEFVDVMNGKYDEGEEFEDKNENGVWNKGGYYESKYMPSFAGVFPCDDPQIVCIISFYGPDITINSNNKWASLTAVPVAQKIFKRLKLKDKDIVL